MIFDTHAHYDDEKYNEDREEVLLSLAGKNVGRVVNIGASFEGAIASAELAKKYDFVYAAVGIHPDDVGVLNEDVMARISALADEEKTVAIGEIGLDYHWLVESRETQKYWFERQMELAVEKDLPIIIHSRDACEDTMELMKKAHEKYGDKHKGIVHCFSYSAEIAKEYVKMGFYIGVGGVATFKNGKKLKEVIAAVPLEKIVLETDCPYLAPEPFRGQRNSSDLIKYVVPVVAGIKGVTEEEVERITWDNACKVYGLADQKGA
ncbi:MAG: TatD family hydrolase [Lachnospiraceae bacterium]|nr:TatD family hydrolase [Lachnospiraceae bacterium]